ncbi:hypothetical protein [Loigolactobacillus backii]|uniref:hypothetical protein n=1 Tax=Loigolactobacillus backii TaxID=375175 RepID=UPI0007F0EDBC|nr:hypothetical protein [Loigolactobacillus backii]ANK59827.1 hypothetical protein AYR52_05870 [Loigolactobacillus backii]
MKRSTFNYIADMLRDYPHIDEYIRDRREMLMYPYDEDHDENVGGGKGNKISKPQENFVVRLEDDKWLQNMLRQQAIITKCLNRANEITKELLDELYFKDIPELTLTGVAVKYHLDKGQLSRYRSAFFVDVAQSLGMQYESTNTQHRNTIRQ